MIWSSEYEGFKIRMNVMLCVTDAVLQKRKRKNDETLIRNAKHVIL